MSLINPSLLQHYCSNLASNYSLIRFIRFISSFTDSSRNAFFISSRFKSPCKCRKKNLEFGKMELNTAQVFLLPPARLLPAAAASVSVWLPLVTWESSDRASLQKETPKRRCLVRVSVGCVLMQLLQGVYASSVQGLLDQYTACAFLCQEFRIDYCIIFS